MKTGTLYSPFASLAGERAVEIDTAVVEGICQRDCVEMKRCDDIGAGRKVLGSKHLQRTQQQSRHHAETHEVSSHQLRHRFRLLRLLKVRQNPIR